jgi:potassium voltage-gated channel Shaker-related subfamily A protein
LTSLLAIEQLPLQQHDCKTGGCQRVIINVSGQRYETQLKTLDRFPNTLLGDPIKRNLYWDSRRNEFFLDRHRPTFQAILYYYQSGGRLRRPIEVPEDVFLEELKFYQLDEHTIRVYRQKEGYVLEKKLVLPDVAWQRSLWLFCEEPDSSLAARVFAVLSIVCILVSVVNFCLETLPNFDRPICVNVSTTGPMNGSISADETTTVAPPGVYMQPNYRDPFFIVESICVTWFSVEFVLRLIGCPSKRHFCRSIMNVFDVLAILPFFVILIVQQTQGNCETAKKSGSFVFIRVLRVFRIFKLSKHSQGLRILGLTIKTSMHELGMFFFFLVVAMVIFSSAAYYAEVGEDGTQLTSIPGAFWWAIVTMTTVGYGDVTPVGIWGKLVGTLCVIAGVLTIALPVPVVVANFNNFYRHDSE